MPKVLIDNDLSDSEKFVMSNCEFVTFPLVSWIRCATWLYRFLIFAPLLTFSFTGLSPPGNIFTDRSKAVLLLWIIYVISVLFLLCFRARLFIDVLWSPAGKGLTSWLSFVVSTVSLSLSYWYPGSGVLLDCIDSWSLHPYLLW